MCRSTGRLRRMGFTLPILALTAMVEREGDYGMAGFGFDDYLLKPITKAALHRAIMRSFLRP